MTKPVGGAMETDTTTLEEELSLSVNYNSNRVLFMFSPQPSIKRALYVVISAHAPKYKIETDYELKALSMQSDIFYSIFLPILPVWGTRQEVGIKPRALNMLSMG